VIQKIKVKCPPNETYHIIEFYNKAFVHATKTFILKELKPRIDQDRSTSSVRQSSVSYGNLILSPLRPSRNRPVVNSSPSSVSYAFGQSPANVRSLVYQFSSCRSKCFGRRLFNAALLLIKGLCTKQALV